jgi:Ca2+-binding EF-hand superfamily protein
MVWLKLILIIFFFTFSLNALELSQEEKNYFNILDLNSDGFVSFDEITQSTQIIFQLIDLNKDNEISLKELEELKKIIGILK